MTAPSKMCINSLYFVGLLILVVKSAIATAEVSKFNETKVVGIESTTVSKISTTTATFPIIESTTKSSDLASTTIDSFIIDEFDYYDEDDIEAPNATEIVKIESSAMESATVNDTVETTTKVIPSENVTTTTTIAVTPSNEAEPVSNSTESSTATANDTQVYESTTVITTTQAVESTTKAIPSENETTTTEPVSNSTESKGIFTAGIVADLYIYYKMVTPIVLRIIFGIIVSVTKVKVALKKPIGIAVVLFCNFFYMPLVSD